MDYKDVFEAWASQPEQFWMDAAKDIAWFEAPKTAYQAGKGWFPDGKVNACHAALDTHVEAGHGDQVAIYYDSPVTGTKRQVTFSELLTDVSAFAAGLKQLGVSHGGRVLIYMPMIPEALVAMLATARLGAVHSVVFGGFAARELAKRVDDFAPDVLVTATCGIEPGRKIPYMPLVNEALAMSAHRPHHVVIKQRPEQEVTLQDGRDVDYDAIIAAGGSEPCCPCPSTDPLYVLYTSGTTGTPKGVVRDIGSYLVALKWSMTSIYSAQPGETYWAASDIGWVVGHSYIVYGPLVNRCSTILYEGKPVGTPDAGAMWRIINEYGVSVAFTAPTAVRAIKREDPGATHVDKYDLSKLRYLFLAGERADPDTVEWVANALKVPVIDHWWQTELGWPALSAFPGLGDTKVHIGAAGRPVPGFAFDILDEDGHPVPRGTNGAIVIKCPLPPGSMTGLWNAPGRFEEQYLSTYDGYYLTGDAGYMDEDGFVFVMGRTDDVMNVAGHRLSTGSIEEVIASHPAVAECAVVGAADELKGQVPVAFVVLKAGADPAIIEHLEKDLVASVRNEVGAVASFRRVYLTSVLPKTRSGKILRKTIRSLIDGQPFDTPATIDNVDAIDAVRSAITEHS
ncbi:MAG: AMP-binding protein [Hyphomonas sp.]|uniref:AMP-binding protein n=1 Tax=Hyphomonas sp. TaxID=87 RepID=UPI003526FB03